MQTTTEVGPFLDALDAELRATKSSLLDAEFLAAVEAASVTREQIGVWAKAFYAATRNSRFGLGNFYANSPEDPELRRELAENLYEEETGRISGVNKCHMDVFFDFLAAFGVSPEEAATLEPPFGRVPPQGRAIAADDFYVELAAYGLNVESPNAEFCERILRALCDNYGFTNDQLTWFSMHASLDADHGAEFRHHAARAATAPDGLARLHEQTLAMSQGVKRVWDGFGLWQQPVT
jgi:pyrroloquinoline quinone (PQQ) biosynthesis protein C